MIMVRTSLSLVVAYFNVFKCGEATRFYISYIYIYTVMHNISSMKFLSILDTFILVQYAVSRYVHIY